VGQAKVLAGVLLVLTVTAALAVIPAGAQATASPEGDVVVYFVPGELDEANVEASGVDGVVGLLSASGCNQSVCIELIGTGLVVDRWRTTASVSSATCSQARFLRNGWVVRTSAPVCSSSSGTLVAVWHGPGGFSHGDQLCNTWSGVAGKPCKTVKA